MNLSFKAKDALNHVKGRKFLYVIVTFIIVVVWALIGSNAVRPSEKETLIVWITESSTDKLNVTELTDGFGDEYKKWGFKEWYVMGGDLSDKEDKMIFSLYHIDVDFYIMPKAYIEEYHSYFLDLIELGFSQEDFTKELYKVQLEGDDAVEEKTLGIKLGEDYVFAVSESATLEREALDLIIDYVNSFTFKASE